METRPVADRDWSEGKNVRRCGLVRKKVAGGLTPDETAELDQLQEQVGQFREQFGPLAADTVRALDAELLRIGRPQPGTAQSSSPMSRSS